ncbi:MAG TPA: hypothetical protein VFS67_12510 [Polyangiaceae bacterium]|jgi:hypothetical protein|nr:hypothetical protein [Polyangiaceae bacterium]
MGAAACITRGVPLKTDAILESSTRRRRALPRVALLFGAALSLGCHTDTTGLEKRPSASGGSGGAAATSTEPDPGAGGAEAPLPLPEPMGSGSLAVLHGLVDGGRLFVCLSDLGAGQALGEDGFESGAGLEFGQFQRRLLDWDVASTDVEVELFAASGPVEGQSCELARQAADTAAALAGSDVDGGSPGSAPTDGPRRLGSLTLAHGSLFAGKHYLLVATGCAAPESFAAPDACGAPDPVFGRRSELVLVEFGAQPGAGSGDFGLQFLNASRALGPADLSLQLEGASDLSVPFVSGVSFGVLRPRAAAVVEAPLALELRGRGTSAVALSQSWADTLRASTPPEFAPGKNYVLASIGPTPRPDGQGLSGPRLVLIPAE